MWSPEKQRKCQAASPIELWQGQLQLGEDSKEPYFKYSWIHVAACQGMCVLIGNGLDGGQGQGIRAEPQSDSQHRTIRAMLR